MESSKAIFRSIKDHKDGSSKEGQGLRIIRVKNRFLNPTFGNYRYVMIFNDLDNFYDKITDKEFCVPRDLLLYVKLIGAGTGFICEIQIHHNEFQNYCLQCGSYEYYLFFRTFFINCMEKENAKRLDSRLKVC